MAPPEPTSREHSRRQAPLSTAGVLLALAGCVGSVWLTLRAVPYPDSPVLRGVTVTWVLCPFALALVLCRLSRRWSVPLRVALVSLTFALLAGSAAIYGNVRPASGDSRGVFTFVAVPLGSLLLIVTVIVTVGLMSRRLSRFRLVRWAIRATAGFILATALGISALLGSLLFDHHQDTVLPAPTGPLAVGRQTVVWTREEIDPLAPPGEGRELLGWIWYPAARARPSSPVDYQPAAWRAAVENQSGAVLSQLLTRDLARVRAHSLRDAPVSPEQPAYPVVLVRGGGAALTTDYTTLAEDLASHGYVVVGFDAPYRSWVAVLPDGRAVARTPESNLDNVSGAQVDQLAVRLAQAWTADCRFVLDQLERLNASDPTGKFRGRLDLEHIAMFGHSLGGATALSLCHDDSRCQAGIDVDGVPLGPVISDGIARPFMFLLSDHRGEASTSGQPEFLRNARANIRSIYDRLPGDGRLIVEIRGANHFLFSDHGALLRSPLLMRVLLRLGIVRLDGRRQLAVTARCIRGFFDVHLKGAPAGELGEKLDCPEIEIAK